MIAKKYAFDTPTPIHSAQRRENQIKAALNEWEFDRRHETIERLLQPRGSITCSINASSLFAGGDGSTTISRNILNRIRGIGVSGFGVRQNITVRSRLSLPNLIDLMTLHPFHPLDVSRPKNNSRTLCPCPARLTHHHPYSNGNPESSTILAIRTRGSFHAFAAPFPSLPVGP